MMHHIRRWSAIFVVAFLGGWLGWMAADREIPVHAADIGTSTPEVEAGGTFRASYTFFRRKSCRTTVDRFIYDQWPEGPDGERPTRYVLPPLTFNQGSLPVGRRDQASVPAQVQVTARPGPALYQTKNCYVCNPLQTLFPNCAPLRNIHFVILPRTTRD